MRPTSLPLPSLPGHPFPTALAAALAVALGATLAGCAVTAPTAGNNEKPAQTEARLPDARTAAANAAGGTG